MRIPLAFLAAILFAATWAFPAAAGEKPPEKPNGEGAAPAPADPPAGEEGENPPGEEGKDEPPAKADPKTTKALAGIKKDLAGSNTKERYEAGQRLLALETPKDKGTLEEYLKVLILGVNILRQELRCDVARKLVELGLSHPELEVAAKIDGILKQIKRNEGKNAEVPVCLITFDFLLGIRDPKACEIIGSFLDDLKDHQAVFRLLLQHSREETIQILAAIATNAKEKNTIKRRDAVAFLGFWGNGPPLYHIRIPALLAAMKSPQTSSEAMKAVKGIALPDNGTKTNQWDAWWKRIEKEREKDPGYGDLAIIRGDFKDVYLNQRGKEKRETGAMAVAEWIRTWNTPAFQWATPILHELLDAADDQELRTRIISVLAGIGSRDSLDPLSKICEALKSSSDRKERAILSDAIRAMARIASTGDPALRQRYGEALSPFLDSLFEEVVEATCEAMGLLGHTAAQKKLMAIITSGTKDRAALKAAEALGQMQAKESLEGLLKELEKSLGGKDAGKTSLAYHIVKALRLMNVRSPEVVNHLINCIACTDERVALEAIDVLSAWQEPLGVAPIKIFFEDEERNLAARIKALKAIAAYPPEHAAEVLFIALRKPASSLTKAWNEARRDPRKEKEAKELGEKVNAGSAFYDIAKTYFSDEGRVLPAHRSELLDIAKEPENNLEGRALCIRWLGRADIYDEEKILPYLVTFIGDEAVAVVEAARDVLKANISNAAMEAVITSLPSNAPSNPPWQEMQKLDVIRWYVFRSDQFNADKPGEPDFAFNRQAWLNWWNKVKSKIKFFGNETDEEKEDEPLKKK